MGLNDIGRMKDTTEVELVDPSSGEIVRNADSSPMTITVYGPYSSHYKSVSNAQQNRRLMKAQRMGGKINITAEEIEASGLDLLVKCTVGWNLSLDEKPEKFTPEKAREVYIAHPWVREQVDAVFGDTRAFLEKSN